LKVYPHPTEESTLLVLTYERCFLSTDGGASFAQVGGGLPVTSSTSLAFDPTNPSVVYGTAGPLGLFRSSDGARTFERLGGLAEDLLLGLGVLQVAQEDFQAEIDETACIERRAIALISDRSRLQYVSKIQVD
jgi:hypothetical protein